MKTKILGLLALGLLAGPMAANAGLLGADVNIDFSYSADPSFNCSNGVATVGTGVEYSGSCGGYSRVIIDILDTGLIVDTGGVRWGSATFNGFLLSVVSGPSLLSASYLGGSMNVTSLVVDTAGIWFNFAGQTGGRAEFSITTASASVPEPGTLALLGLGLVGMGYARRRKSS